MNQIIFLIKSLLIIIFLIKSPKFLFVSAEFVAYTFLLKFKIFFFEVDNLNSKVVEYLFDNITYMRMIF